MKGCCRLCALPYLLYGELFAGGSRDFADALSVLLQTQSHNLLQREVCTVLVKGALHLMIDLIPMSGMHTKFKKKKERERDSIIGLEVA